MMSVPTHWHVTINGETLTSSHVALSIEEADQIHAETVNRTIATDIVVISECRIRCQDILDVLAFWTFVRLTIDDLDEAERQVMAELEDERWIRDQADGR